MIAIVLVLLFGTLKLFGYVVKDMIGFLILSGLAGFVKRGGDSFEFGLGVFVPLFDFLLGGFLVELVVVGEGVVAGDVGEDGFDVGGFDFAE